MSAEIWQWIAVIAALGIVVVLAYELWAEWREERAYDRKVHDRMAGINEVVNLSERDLLKVED